MDRLMVKSANDHILSVLWQALFSKAQPKSTILQYSLLSQSSLWRQPSKL